MLFGIALLICRAFIFSWLASNQSQYLVSADTDDRLRPVEFAYLSRHGDTAHALAVLGVDLLQRGIKSQTSSSNSEIALANYEIAMWEMVKRSMKNWAQETKESVLIESLKKDPVGYAKRMSKIYRFLRQTLASFVGDTIKDPRHLRRYFSFGGIWKLLTDFSTAGYQQSFENELQTDLLQRGFLVERKRKTHAAQAFWLLGLAGLCISFLVATQVFDFWLWLIFLFSVATARAVLLMQQLVPYYADLFNLLIHIHRISWRISLIKAILAIFRLGFYLASLFTFLGGLLVAFLYVHLGHPRFLDGGMANSAFLPVFDLTGICIFIILLALLIWLSIDLSISGWQIVSSEWPTKKGDRLVLKVRNQIKSLSPLNELAKVLQTPEYDQTFSYIVGLYGIETLLFLA